MTTTKTTATTPDYDEIVRVVQLYVDGMQGDVDKFKEAFDEDAWIFFTDADGVLHKNLISDDFERWASNYVKEHIVGRFISVTQAGDVANVLLGFDNHTTPSNSWADFHTLLRINGAWKITNKTATHCSKAAWAAAQ